ncbi:MAG: TMEM165/GDT1 family protein [Clostridia bacterium]
MNEYIIALISAFFITGIAELGDKTQLLVMTMSAKYKVRDVLLGIIIAIIALNVMAVGLGSAITKLIPMELISVFAGIAFIMFAISSLLSKKEDDTSLGKSKSHIPIFIIIAFTFFLAELGDKTQIVVIAIAAQNKGFEIPVLIGAVAGMIIIDSLGLVIGNILKSKLNSNHLKWLSIVIFTVFGELTLFSVLKDIIGIPFTVLILTLIIVLLILIYLKTKMTKKTNLI